MCLTRLGQRRICGLLAVKMHPRRVKPALVSARSLVSTRPVHAPQRLLLARFSRNRDYRTGTSSSHCACDPSPILNHRQSSTPVTNSPRPLDYSESSMPPTVPFRAMPNPYTSEYSLPLLARPTLTAITREPSQPCLPLIAKIQIHRYITPTRRRDGPEIPGIVSTAQTQCPDRR